MDTNIEQFVQDCIIVLYKSLFKLHNISTHQQWQYGNGNSNPVLGILEKIILLHPIRHRRRSSLPVPSQLISSWRK